MSWHFLPELAGASSEATSSDGRPSARSKSKRIPGRCFSADNGTVCSPCSPSGTTSAPSTDDPGVVAWMSSLAGFPVKTSAPPAVEKVSPESGAAYGERWPGLLAKWDPATRSWKTAQGLLLGGLESFSETWPRSGMTRFGTASPLPPSAPLTDETESGFWHTPTAQESGARIETLKTKDGQDAKVGERAYRHGPDGKVTLQSVTLGQQVRMWPTPNASDYKAGMSNAPNRQQVSLPRSVGVAEGIKSGRRGGLNPVWVEWIMGWPLGWTDLVALEMGRFREWSSAHGGR